MAFSATFRCSSSLCPPLNNSTISRALPRSSSSLSFRSSPSLFNRKKSLSIRSATLEVEPEKELSHLSNGLGIRAAASIDRR